ncbi:Lysozyme-like domain-containing protein [Rhodotorula toruloides]|uniref:BY PROTMAP: gi/472584721/gb/EMS22307.1/ glycoside hydrolase family 23 protein [Rhodosporidium toruloides NP11] gi/647399172/emb/CDR43692.1/ RHTO0S08e04500g1_1 [Rhodosporidium toruloides] n=1 Tax=Rhodotorula toruloides TaxID=5286 RepID=A0A0K3CDN6_RHOTO|nr:Lysozyme-like domain-containing protein [Rhodotorula toruloides]
MQLHSLVLVACAGAAAALKPSSPDFHAQVLPAGPSPFPVASPFPGTSHRLVRRSARCHRLSRASRTASRTSTSDASSPTWTPASTASLKGSGLFGVSDDKCGSSGATEDSTASGGPNGSEDWLNCGISKASPDSGWTPPTISLSSIRTISLSTALSMPNSVYSACKPYVSLFEEYGDKYGSPPILLAAFAMQESSCDPKVMGDNGGAYGLMQITEDKCGDAPNGGCADPDYNVKTAAAYFAQVLKEHNGSLLLALGTYNGWYSGLTYNKANAIPSECCQCVNGWLLGIDGSTLGTIRNAVCS